METIKQLEKEIEGVEKVWEQFHNDKSPDKPIEKWTKEEHDRWKKWNKKQEKLKQEHKKKYGRIQSLEPMKAKLQTLKDVVKEIDEMQKWDENEGKHIFNDKERSVRRDVYKELKQKFTGEKK